MHNLKNLNRTPEESVAGFADCVKMANENNIAISGSISMPFASPWEGRTPVEDVDAIIEAYLKVGIDEISFLRSVHSRPRKIPAGYMVAALPQHQRRSDR